MLPIINLGPLSLPLPQLLLLAGLWLGSTLSERQAKKAGRSSEIIFKVIWISILAGILGGRFSFIARNPSAFQDQWTSIFSLNKSLFDPAGGLFIAITSGLYVASRNKSLDWILLDDLTPFFSIVITAYHLANFASGSAFGIIADLPWAIELWGGQRHPVQLYYAAASLVILYLVTFKNNILYQGPGSTFLFLILYTSGYLTILSAFQDPAGYLVAGFRILQLFSWVLFTFSILIYIKLKTRGAENALS